jgi:DNA-binding NarL/FixJ family response regulator
MFAAERIMRSKPKARSQSGPKASDKSLPQEPARKRIFLVDDHPMMRDAMSTLIDTEPGLLCCGGAKSAEEALDEIARCKPDLIITDITLPSRSGLDPIKDLAAMYPELPVFVYSMHDEIFYAERALRAGARGYLMKEAGSEKMLEAIHQLLAGQVCVSPKLAAKILNQFSGAPSRGSNSPVEKLTNREFDVYQLIGKGRSTKEIADQLHISPKTVAIHREHIKEKLAITNATELTHHAIRWVASQEAR